MGMEGNFDRQRDVGIDRNIGTSGGTRSHGERPSGGQSGSEKLSEKAHELKARGEEAGERIQERAGEVAEKTRHRFADKLEDMGERMEERGRTMGEQGGIRGRAGDLITRAGDRLEDGAEYMRTHSVREEVSEQVRSHPLISVGLATGVGFLLGRGLSGGGDKDEEKRQRNGRAYAEPFEAESQRGFLRRPIRSALMAAATGLVVRSIRRRLAG